MLRLSVLLSATIFVTLLIAGEDKGQMRPGLAAAVAAGEEIIVLERRKPTPVRVAAVAKPKAAPITPESDAIVETVAYAPEEPAVAIRKITPEPVFTLSTLPTVTRDPTVDAAQSAPAAAVAGPVVGNVWFVTANTVNVRQGPSTDTAVVEKLTLGEAVSVEFEEGSDWARVTIQGDGIEGYVALRLLSPVAP